MESDSKEVNSLWYVPTAQDKELIDKAATAAINCFKELTPEQTAFALISMVKSFEEISHLKVMNAEVY